MNYFRAPKMFVLLAALWPSGPLVAQQTFTETFDGGSNEGGWTYGAPTEVIEATGGNPGAFLHASGLDSFAPQPRTGFGVPSEFTGDYRARGIDAVGVDLILFAVDFSAEGRPLTVMLISDNDTPGDFSDDWAAYRIGPDNIPLVGEGWLSYGFEVPSAETSLPAGWQTIGFGPGSPPAPDWNQVITDVTQLRFFYGDPALVFIFQMWEVGLDNPSIFAASAIFSDGFEKGNTGAWALP